MNAAVAILVWIFTLIVLIVIIGEIRFRQSLKKESNHSYYVRKIEEIKKVLKNNKYPCHFDKIKFRGKKLNCYAYALDINVSDSKELLWLPGCISDENLDKNIWSTPDLIERLKKDLDFLGISYRDNSNNLLEGEWRIAIYYEPATYDFPIGFHISRQDIDGIWSEKPSWEGKIKKIGDKSNIPPNLEKSHLYLKNVLILSKNK